MHRKTVHRGIAALALVTILTVAGAQPAAAADLGFLDRLANFWSAVTGEEPTNLWDTLTGWFGGTEKATSTDTTITDRGAGIDPNGNTLTSSTTDPTASSPNG